MSRVTLPLLLCALLSACGASSDPLPSGEEDSGGTGGGATGGKGGSGGKGGKGGATGAGGQGGVTGAGGQTASGGATASGGSGGVAASGGSGPPSGGSGGGEATGGTIGSGGSEAGGAGDVDAGSGGSEAMGGSTGGPDGGVVVGDGGVLTYFAPIPAGMTSIFDGKTLNGWTGSNIWSVNAADMAIEGKTANGGQLLKSKDDYLDFRLILTERMVATPNHMGICFWGTRGGTGYGGCIDVIPPSGALWDYGGGGMQPGGVGPANNPIKYLWHQVEILATGSTGEILVAVNGKQTTTYKKAGRGKNGPIGLQSHAKANDQEYKDIWVEANPKEHKLLTVRP